MAADNGAQGMAARFALSALNPFVLEGIDYSAFNNNNVLDLFNPASGAGIISDQYLEDRVTMLVRKLWFNINDENPYNLFAKVDNHDFNIHQYLKSGTYFEDAATGYKIKQGGLFGNTPRYYFGNDTAETPAGSASKDRLYGGGGNDTLQGLEGNDYLEGGTGTDTYIVNQGDGIDTILDVDGLGSIQFGANTAQGKNGVTDVVKDWIKIGDRWIDQQNGLEYVLQPQSNGSNDLLVKSTNGSGVLIKAWQEGQLGITLAGNESPVIPAYDLIITGDLEPVDPPEIDELGNVVVTANPAPDRADTLFGSTGNDLIQSFGGNDTVSAKEGDDRVEGGTGSDTLSGNWGNDIIVGGAGSDNIFGNEDDDRLFADTEYTIDDAYVTGEAQVGSGSKGSLLDGYLGNDFAVGEAGDDVLLGGSGKDILMGLGGNDTIEGDRYALSADINWTVTRTTDNGNGTTVFSRDYSFPTLGGDSDIGDDDVIYGGAGNDWIFAQGGNDFIDAGADDDVIFGEAGNDIIFGQAGNDNLVGDARPSTLNASLHGDDYLVGGDGDDKIWGEGGSDYLEGGAGADDLYGDTSDIPVEYQGNDTLDGGEGNDRLFGYYGNDTLIGGSGIDELYGGPGDDTYVGVEMFEIIGDVQGKNTIILADSTTVVTSSANEPLGFSLAAMSFNEPVTVPTNAPASVTWLTDTGVLRMTLEDGSSIDLQGALYGMDAQIYYDHGAQGIDLEAWVGENLHEAVTLNLNVDWTQAGFDDQLTYAYGGAEADTLFGGTLNDTLKGGAGNDQLQGDAGDDLIVGGSGADNLIGQDGNDTLLGGDDNDELQGNLGDDILEGEGGDDTLFGQEGSDTLNGGAGNDILSGNAGDDTYLFNLGDGADVIWEEGDSAGDVLRFGEGIAPADITAAKTGVDLVLFHANGQDQVTISNWYLDSSWRLAQIEFADGTIWNGADLTAQGALYLRGTEFGDYITGTAANETLSGLDGNDQLYGNSGNDILIGGKGNDYLHGGDGQNTFIFGLGDGADTLDVYWDFDQLRFAADITPADITVERVGNNLVLRHQNGTDSVTVQSWYLSSLEQLKQVVFDADGTAWTQTTLTQMGMNVDHHYTLNLGDGAKTIENFGGNDSLTIGAGISDADIAISRVGQNLKLAHTNGADSVTIIDWFNDLTKQIETVQFSDSGTLLTEAQLTTPFLTLTGTSGNDTLQGGNAYDETLVGLAGNDTLNGGGGADTYIFNLGDGQDTIVDTSPTNSLIFGPGLLNLVTVTFDPNFDVNYTFGADSVKVTAASNVSAKFITDGTAAADTLNGSDFRDIIHGLDGNDTITGGANQDELYGDAGNDTLIGGEGSDWLYGGDGDDILDGSRLTGANDSETFGSDAADYYVGGKGNDTLQGNSQDDHYYFNLGDGNDTIIEGSFFLSGQWFYSLFDDLNFGPGITQNSIQVSQVNNDLLVTVSASDSVTIKNWFADFKARVDTFRFNDGSSLNATDISRLLNTQYGTDGDDVLTGNASADNVLYGEAGNDTLTGGNGNDELYGGTGNDTIYGRGGNDAYYFNRGDGQDIINDTGGSDTIYFDASISASDIVLSRNANNLVLSLAGTNDSIAIEDYMNGNLSLSTVSGSSVVNYTNFYLIESYVFPDGGSLPAINSIQDSFLNIRGTTADDTLAGTAWADVMYGSDGNDALYGLEDDDVLYGGAGNDYLDGGPGSINLLYGEDGDDVLIGGGGAGFGSSSYLHGGNGSDTYVFIPGATFTILDAAGIDDRIQMPAGVNLTDLSFQQWDANDLTISVATGGSIDIYNQFLSSTTRVERIQFADGTELGLRDIQFGAGGTLTGTADDSILIGTSANDTLNGGGGNDWLDGKAGGDTMTGGTGNDIYFVNDRKDTVIELTGEGIDTVLSDMTYSLGANVENLVLTGSAAINGTGNTLDNRITGNDAANTLNGDDGNDWLDGKGGADKLQGGYGDDTYVVDMATDSIVERSGQGTDSVLSSVSYVLPGNVENLTLIGTAAINGTGNTLNNILTGNSAANTLTGDKGNDTYVIGRGSNTDTVIDIDATNNNLDTAQFLTGITANQIWFQHVGNNLEVSIIGTNDKLIINNWYLGAANHIEEFKTDNGLTLQDSQVENLVNAMSGFVVPDIGQTELPADYATTLDPIIASLWV